MECLELSEFSLSPFALTDIVNKMSKIKHYYAHKGPCMAPIKTSSAYP